MYFITTAWGPSLKTDNRELREYVRTEYGAEDTEWVFSRILRVRKKATKRAQAVACLLPPKEFASAASA
jgi:hypothetical protein